MRWLSTVLLLLALLPTVLAAPPTPTRPANVAVAVWEATANGGRTDFLVVLEEQADLSGAERLATQQARGQFVVARLRAVAQRTQAGLGQGRCSGQYRPQGVENSDFGTKPFLLSWRKGFFMFE
jgi:hypothetical protein